METVRASSLVRIFHVRITFRASLGFSDFGISPSVPFRRKEIGAPLSILDFDEEIGWKNRARAKLRADESAETKNPQVEETSDERSGKRAVKERPKRGTISKRYEDEVGPSESQRP